MATALRNSRKRKLADMTNFLMVIMHCVFWLGSLLEEDNRMGCIVRRGQPKC
jgi:hypothetical protein